MHCSKPEVYWQLAAASFLRYFFTFKMEAGILAEILVDY
jgi:hypothetical protein